MARNRVIRNDMTEEGRMSNGHLIVRAANEMIDRSVKN